MQRRGAHRRNKPPPDFGIHVDGLSPDQKHAYKELHKMYHKGTHKTKKNIRFTASATYNFEVDSDDEVVSTSRIFQIGFGHTVVF